MAKILHIAAHLGAGAGKAIGGLAVADKSNEHRIYLLTEPQKLNHINYCREHGVPVYVGGAFKTLLAENDVLIINWWAHTAIDQLLADFPKTTLKKIFWLHRNGIHDPPLPQTHIDLADAFLITSEFSRKHPALADSTLVYGFGCFMPETFAPKTDYMQVGKHFTVGFIGEPQYKKLPRNWLDYCEAVIQVIPTVKFVVAGEVSQGVMSDVAQRGLSNYFSFTGWVDDIQSLLISFDVFGYLLRPDTFATTENAVLEALSSGVPCVLSQEPLGKYLLEDGKSGFLVRSPQEYAEILNRLYKDAVLREKIGRAGREYCIQRYHIKQNIKNFKEGIGI